METLEKRFEGNPSTQLAVASFCIGTLLFLYYMCFPAAYGLLVVGVLYVALAAIANIAMLLNLAYHFIKLPNQREYIGVKALILLSNIPIAYVYYCFVLHVYGQTQTF